jgi:hypothetical protein
MTGHGLAPARPGTEPGRRATGGVPANGSRADRDEGPRRSETLAALRYLNARLGTARARPLLDARGDRAAADPAGDRAGTDPASDQAGTDPAGDRAGTDPANRADSATGREAAAAQHALAQEHIFMDGGTPDLWARLIRGGVHAPGLRGPRHPHLM